MNTCLNHLKHSKRQVPLPEERELAEDARSGNPHNNPETSLEESQKMKKLEIAIDTLPPKWKAVLVLRAHENLSYDEISNVLKIPKGTQSGSLLRMRGQGVTNVNGRGKGDQYVRVNVAVPTKLTKRQEELLAEFSKIEHENMGKKNLWEKLFGS